MGMARSISLREEEEEEGERIDDESAAYVAEKELFF